MKLYFCPGTCSLAPRIVAHEAGIDLESEQVDIREKKTKSGADFWAITPKGYVPVLELDASHRMTEVPVIVQYLADQKPGSGLAAPAGSPDRYRAQEWLNFVGTELHKTFGPLFRPTTPEEFKTLSRELIARRLDYVEKQLAGKQYLMGDNFTVPDSYLYTVLRWAPRAGVDLSGFPNIRAYVARVSARPKVQEALEAEGLA